MGRYIARRLLLLIPVLLFISLVTFSLMHSVPGGPFTREKALRPEILRNLEKHYCLDEPLWKQYVQYLIGGCGDSKGVLRLDFGPTYSSRSRTVNDIFQDNLPVSFQLGLWALLVAVVMGLPLGVVAALKQNTIWDYVSMGVAVLGVSIPNMVMGPLLIWIFALGLGLLPVAGWGKPSQVIMPVLALGATESARIARLTRASMLQVIREDYIRTARAKGLTERVVTVRHALRNALIPVITILGPLFAYLVTGTIIIEMIFGIPGMGRFFVTSITNRDYPVIMGTILLYAVVLVLTNLLVDLTYAFLDPRIRYE
jgi:ABC-type dipeptide/oligopeptide/nickel transport system permease component